MFIQSLEFVSPVLCRQFASLVSCACCQFQLSFRQSSIDSARMRTHGSRWYHSVDLFMHHQLKPNHPDTVPCLCASMDIDSLGDLGLDLTTGDEAPQRKRSAPAAPAAATRRRRLVHSLPQFFFIYCKLHPTSAGHIHGVVQVDSVAYYSSDQVRWTISEVAALPESVPISKLDAKGFGQVFNLSPATDQKLRSTLGSKDKPLVSPTYKKPVRALKVDGAILMDMLTGSLDSIITPVTYCLAAGVPAPAPEVQEHNTDEGDHLHNRF